MVLLYNDENKNEAWENLKETVTRMSINNGDGE